MPAIGLIIIFIQIGFAIHALKRDEWNWVFLILIIPVLGCVLYAILVYFPEINNAKRTRRILLSSGITMAPGREMKKKLFSLKSTSNIDKHIQLAEELVNNGLLNEAITLYQNALAGQLSGNPKLMLGLAKVYFKNQKFSDAKLTLEELIKINPKYKSLKGHLLYARTLEALDDSKRAREEYEAIVKYNQEPEVLCAYAVFLRKNGEDDMAKKYFERILTDTSQLPKEQERVFRKWINVAKQELLNW